MAGKKGVIPSHVKKTHFEHPGIACSVGQLLEQVEDSRSPSPFFRYSLASVLCMTLIGIMYAVTDWPKMIVVARGLSSWMSNYVDMTAGIYTNELKSWFLTVSATLGVHLSWYR
jgi:hypothetical protein